MILALLWKAKTLFPRASQKSNQTKNIQNQKNQCETTNIFPKSVHQSTLKVPGYNEDQVLCYMLDAVSSGVSG